MTSPTTDCVKQVAQDISLAIETTGSAVVSLAKSLTYFFICLVLACIIVLTALKKINFVSVFSIILLTAIFFILLTTMGSSVLSVSLPFSTYPNPPHLGLDGVSPANYLAGKQMN
jgi:hypothetical protein